MASRGFLIRFIDIGLIVLFGFLMISDIEASSRVELAGERPESEEEVDVEQDSKAFVLVEIAASGAYRVSDPMAAEEDAVWAPDADALTEELRRRRGLNRERDTETVVLLEPDPASLVQHTVDAMDVCDRLSVAKSLRMDIEVAAGVSGAGNGGEPPDGAQGGEEER